MKTKLNDIKKRHELLLNVGRLTLPRKISAAIARNLVKLEKETELYNKQRLDIADRYAKKDDKGNFILTEAENVPSYTFENKENEAAFLAEVKDLNETEIDVDIMKFNESELGQCDSSERYDILTPVQEASIEWMIDYGKEE